jgi:hypothetical protein
MSKPEIILKESQAIIDAETLLKTPVGELSDDVALTAWSVLDLFEKNLIKTRKGALRVLLLDRAETLGEENAKGSFVYKVPGTDGKVTKQKKRGKAKLDARAVELLINQKIDEGKLTSVAHEDVISYDPVVDEDALGTLVAIGAISQQELAEVSSVSEPTFALVVKKPSEVTALLEEKNAK